MGLVELCPAARGHGERRIVDAHDAIPRRLPYPWGRLDPCGAAKAARLEFREGEIRGTASVRRSGALRRRHPPMARLRRDSEPTMHPPNGAQSLARGALADLTGRTRRRRLPAHDIGSAHLRPNERQCEDVPHGSPSFRCLRLGGEPVRPCRSGHPGFTLRAAGSVRFAEGPRHRRASGKDGGTSRVAVHHRLKGYAALLTAARW